MEFPAAVLPVREVTADEPVPAPAGPGVELRAYEVDLHGHRVLFRAAGTGPAVVLIHGMVNSSRHWARVAEQLATDFCVIAPDLLGHGESAKPEGDYSLGAHAAGVRDLLSAIGVDRASIVGHSLGGGIAMQFFYQFPDRCERLGLVSSGGLGREVSTPLRFVATPLAGPLLAAVANGRLLDGIARAAEAVEGRSPRLAGSARIYVRGLRPLAERDARSAFIQTLRAVIGPRGQRVSARDRLYLAGVLPTRVFWGDRDHTIPIAHGHAACELMPETELVEISDAGHFPHIENPSELASALREFLETTTPARLETRDWRGLLRRD